MLGMQRRNDGIKIWKPRHGNEGNEKKVHSKRGHNDINIPKSGSAFIIADLFRCYLDLGDICGVLRVWLVDGWIAVEAEFKGQRLDLQLWKSLCGRSNG
jgi:hypothetical protein